MAIDDDVRKVMEENKGFVVIMAGSDSDEPHIAKIEKSLQQWEVPYQVRIASAHKQGPKVEEVIEEYNEVGALYTIVGVAGGTDALSGTASFHAYGLVISCPPDTYSADKSKPDKFNETCLTNPPGSPNVYIARPGNVGKAVAQMYAGVNPRFRELLEERNAKKITGLEKADEKFREEHKCLTYEQGGK